jgi:hypothetical protein
MTKQGKSDTASLRDRPDYQSNVAIEVTPDMITAGVGELLGFSSEDGGAAEVAERVFRAMVSASSLYGIQQPSHSQR